MKYLKTVIKKCINASLEPAQQKRYDAIKEIVEGESYAKIDGVTIDLTTANMLLQIADNLKEENQKKFLSLPIRKMVDVGWKLIKK